uniref:Uncharacterized protein n=1 Tax=Lygus hesperus TaxID=30085 RepID=A0A0A9XVC0_LYGHE
MPYTPHTRLVYTTHFHNWPHSLCAIIVLVLYTVRVWFHPVTCVVGDVRVEVALLMYVKAVYAVDYHGRCHLNLLYDPSCSISETFVMVRVGTAMDVMGSTARLVMSSRFIHHWHVNLCNSNKSSCIACTANKYTNHQLSEP